MKIYPNLKVLAVVAVLFLGGGRCDAAKQEDGLLGPPPPVPHVGPVDRAPMTYEERFSGACGPLRMDLRLQHIEAVPGSSSFVTRITRWRVRSEAGPVTGPPVQAPTDMFVPQLTFDCYGEDRLVISLDLEDGIGRSVARRTLEYVPSGVRYDYTRDLITHPYASDQAR